MEPLRNRVDDSGPDSATNAQSTPFFQKLSRMAKGPRNPRNDIPRFKRHQFSRAFAHGLDDQRDRAGVRIRIGYGERNALGPLTAVDDHELSRLAYARQTRGFNIQPGHVRTELSFPDNLVHFS